MKLTPALDELLLSEDVANEMGINAPITFAVTNCDDIFFVLNVLGITEVAVNRYQMLQIARFMVANVGRIVAGQKLDVEAWKALSEGRVDKFLGVKLKLV